VLNQISLVVQDAINQQVFPGCQVLIARKGKIIYEENFGYLTYQASDAVSSNTLYDLASVSKVASTLQAIMLLYDRGQLNLTDKASKFLPELLTTDKKNITIKELLIHKSGLVSYYPTLWRNTMSSQGELNPEYYQTSLSKEFNLQVAPKLYAHHTLPDSVWKWIIESPLRTKSARASEYSFVYSDLGFMMLQKVIERITNQSLDTFVNQQLYEPLHIPLLTYRPLTMVSSERIAPTENDSKYRGQLIQGTVHDPMAAMVGGIAGHAGLFGNARSLSTLLQMNLWKGNYAGKQYLKPSTLEEFTKLASLSGNRALGWVKGKQDPQSNVVSPNASPASYGHTGFTGNVVWVDPKEELIFIFLSNRVYPNAENNRLNSHMTRRKIHDLIYQAIETPI
jgi:CubicO group peptidase (beta-lactamase class C family)